MKTILFLNDENGSAELMLQNIAPTKMTPRETERFAGCNCDRWGHPCPGCDERKGSAGRASHFLTSQTDEVNTWNT